MDKSSKQKAIEHYDRMIEYMEKQKENDRQTAVDKMLIDIKETTGSKDCLYCKKYDFENNYTNACLKCELSNNNIDHGCCNGLYIKMARSETRKIWLEYAKQVRQYIIDNG